ncbi:peroxidase 2-like isoform X2 [Miscanthus floridulus]|uniref:peroxidase 2-like isoform X2 n=1 Tax=Miscanthus floridulus TaxID=154761 RepID=UPI0034580EC7
MAAASVSVQAIVLLAVAAVASAQLSATFYDSSCPRALGTIRSAVTAAVSRDPRMGASLLRLHFHDCFVQGCDASVLLADTANFTGEQSSFPNRGSLRGFDVVDSIKAQVEAVCPRTVSCADILAVAARDSVATLGGPPYTVLLGRRDSTTASLSQANSDLPPPGSSLDSLISGFARKGLTTTDMVALSGAHTVGQAQCANFRSRLYGESNLNQSDAAALRANCPQSGGNGNLAPMDLETPNTFDGAFFRGLLSQRGVLHSDQQLFSGGSTDALVQSYASNAAQFRNDFAAAMVRMGSVGVLTGSQGQIRLSCSSVN